MKCTFHSQLDQIQFLTFLENALDYHYIKGLYLRGPSLLQRVSFLQWIIYLNQTLLYHLVRVLLKLWSQIVSLQGKKKNRLIASIVPNLLRILNRKYSVCFCFHASIKLCGNGRGVLLTAAAAVWDGQRMNVVLLLLIRDLEPGGGWWRPASPFRLSWFNTAQVCCVQIWSLLDFNTALQHQVHWFLSRRMFLPPYILNML